MYEIRYVAYHFYDVVINYTPVPLLESQYIWNISIGSDVESLVLRQWAQLEEVAPGAVFFVVSIQVRVIWKEELQMRKHLHQTSCRKVRGTFS